MYTEVTRIRKPDPHVHEGDPNPVHTEVAKMAVFGSDICADLSGSCRRRRCTRTREVQRSRRVARDLSQDAIMANRHSAYSSLQSEDEEASYYSAPSRVVHRMPSDVTDYGDGYLAPRPLSGVSGTSGSSVSSRSLPEPPQVRTYVYLNLS